MLNRKTFFIREHVGLMKLVDTFDILDPETRQPLGIAKEKPSTLVQVMRLVVNKRLMPTAVYVYEGSDPQNEDRLLFTIRRGFTLFRARIDVCDAGGHALGWFKSKAFSLGGAFRVFDASDREVALVQGDWKGWNFRFVDGEGRELGTITKKWAGMGKELFRSADNYMIALTEAAKPADAVLLLAAGLAVDTVYKEK